MSMTPQRAESSRGREQGVGEVRERARANRRAALFAAMWLFVVAYVAGLVFHPPGWPPYASGMPGLLGMWVGVCVCALAVRRAGWRTWETVLPAAAVLAQVLGFTYLAVISILGQQAPLPSPADIGFSLFNLLVLAGLFLAVRDEPRGLASSVWLDSAVGALGAASVLAVLLGPILGPSLTGSPSLAGVVSLSYPLSDLILLAAIAGMVTVRGARSGRHLVYMALGLAVFAATDAPYALQRNAGEFVLGTPLDAGWAIGLALMAMSVDAASRRDGSGPARDAAPATRMSALAVPTVAIVAALGVLVVGTQRDLAAVAIVLATVALVAGVARTQLAFGTLARLASRRGAESATDSLTGLANRRSLSAQVQERLGERNDRSSALLLLDLNKFKEVNDTLGHHVGDRLLVEVASRLRERLRDGDVIARLGGDEFAALLEDCDGARAEEVAVMLRTALAAPFELAGRSLRTSASIGIAVFPGDGPDLSALLRKADIAMYKAKTSRAGHHLFHAADAADAAIRAAAAGELRCALERDELVLHYQPKIDLPTGEVRGVEALVRWDHPTRGLLYPEAFLDLIEEFGLMQSLTRVVLERALDQAARWRSTGRDLTVAVNLAASSLVDDDLPDDVAAMLVARGLPPQVLQVEITEGFFWPDRPRARALLTRLRTLGVQISVDDFGGGASALSFLHDLPIDELKLDRTFVSPMGADSRVASLVASTIAFAHGLDLRLVAEGVEDDLALAALARLGCDQAQGYLMSSPVPAYALDAWLSAR